MLDYDGAILSVVSIAMKIKENLEHSLSRTSSFAGIFAVINQGKGSSNNQYILHFVINIRH
jgi:hypothetical protein